uniref:Olfactory receptor family 2 subfamily B member 3 n=1 Tax=Cebus imitator TaxID=2715852 RepID=A0A2K5S2V7_CEBIM
MNWANESSLKEFVLLGFSDKPWLQTPLFVVLLISYTITIFGKVSIMMVCILDPKLHTPMYFFLTNLSILDLCYTTTTVPHMLRPSAMLAQLIISLALGATECLPLAVMSFDRFVAVCRPLPYVVIMNYWFCLRMAAFSLLAGFRNSVLQSSLTLNMPMVTRKCTTFSVRCLPFPSCYVLTQSLLRLSSYLVLLIPVTLILISYSNSSHIDPHILWLHSLSSIKKQVSRRTAKSVWDMRKMESSHPFIYSLRNKDIKEAFKRVMPRIFFYKK